MGNFGCGGGIRYMPGQWYVNMMNSTTQAITDTRLYLRPFDVQQSVTITDLGVNVTAGAAGEFAAIGLYGPSNAYGLPTGATLLGSVTGLDLTNPAFVSGTLPTPVNLSAGRYWIGVLFTGGFTPTMRCDSVMQDALPLAPVGTAPVAGTGIVAGYLIGSLSSLPTTLPAPQGYLGLNVGVSFKVAA